MANHRSPFCNKIHTVVGWDSSGKTIYITNGSPYLVSLRPTIINSLFPVLVREKYHAGGRLLFIILLKIIIISRINDTYTLGIYKCIKHAYISVFCWSFYSVHILTLTKHPSSKLYELSKRFTHVYNRLSKTRVQ